LKAVYSFWTPNNRQSYTGYNKIIDLVASTALSLECSKKIFSSVELVTNNWGKSIFIDKYKLPFDSVNTDLENIKVEPHFWAYAKIYAYSIQKEPFCHIDNDVFIWDKSLIDKVKNKEIFFQSKEPFNEIHGWYEPLLECYKGAPNIESYFASSPVDFGWNCGIVGANNLDLIQDWIHASESFILDKENIEYVKKNKDLIRHQNLLHEQYFIACILEYYGRKEDKEIGVLLKDYKNSKGYTHTWGTTKKIEEIVLKVRKRLLDDYPQYAYLFK